MYTRLIVKFSRIRRLLGEIGVTNFCLCNICYRCCVCAASDVKIAGLPILIWSQCTTTNFLRIARAVPRENSQSDSKRMENKLV